MLASDVVTWLKSDVVPDNSIVEEGPTTPDYPVRYYVVMKQPNQGYRLDGLFEVEQYRIVCAGDQGQPDTAQSMFADLSSKLHLLQHVNIGSSFVLVVEKISGPEETTPISDDPLDQSYVAGSFNFEVQTTNGEMTSG